MNKKEVQQRVLKDGKPLGLNKFEWDEQTNTFISDRDGLILDFRDMDNCTFETGSQCMFYTGSYCTFKTGTCCTFDTGSHCTFNTGSFCTFDTCSFCVFKTASECTFKTGAYCTFNTGFGGMFKTDFGCTFETGAFCMFRTGASCTFDTGSHCVIFRYGTAFEIIHPSGDEIIKLCPTNIEGYISKRAGENAFYMDIEGQRVEHIIADDILSKVISKKGNVYHVINHGEKKPSYLIQDGDIYSHGATLKEAKENLKYKISNRDTSIYDNYTLDTEITKDEAIKMYRVITGACVQGTKYFCEHNEIPKKMTVEDLIELTGGQYGNKILKEFFEKDGER